MNSVEFLCKCNKNKNWITENQITTPCPNCGRSYKGEYNSKKLTIDAIEVLKSKDVIKMFNQEKKMDEVMEPRSKEKKYTEEDMFDAFKHGRNYVDPKIDCDIATEDLLEINRPFWGWLALKYNK